MLICDSHCHVSTVWFSPVESLVHEMDQNGVERAVLVQMRGQYDNSYQADCVRRYPGRFASVVVVDTDEANAPRALECWAKKGAVGVRLRADTRSPGSDPLAIWRAADELGLAVSCQGSAGSFAAQAFANLVQELPNLPIVLEHYGGLEHPGGRAAEQPAADAHVPELAGVLALSRFPNVYVKVHGLGEFAVRAMPVPQASPDGSDAFPFVRPIPPLLEELCEAFGADRLMWASDYPPVCIREGFRLALGLVEQELSRKSPREREAIFGGTALRVFPIRA